MRLIQQGETVFLSSMHALSGVAREKETPSAKAAEGVFSVGILLIPLVAPYDQNLSQAYKLMRGGTRRA